MKLDEVLDVVYKMENEIYRETGKRPRFIIYMDYDFLGECYAELRRVYGLVKTSHLEFANNGTIFGHRVYPVSAYMGNGHPPYVVHTI